LLVLLLGQLENHERPVAAWIQIGIGMTPHDPFFFQDAKPVILINLLGLSALFRIAENKLIGSETDIPIGILGNQKFKVSSFPVSSMTKDGVLKGAAVAPFWEPKN
jgi:hypothetical protein